MDWFHLVCALAVARSLLVWACEVDVMLGEGDDRPGPAYLAHAVASGWPVRLPHLAQLVVYAAFGWWIMVAGTMLVLLMIELALSVARCELVR